MFISGCYLLINFVDKSTSSITSNIINLHVFHRLKLAVVNSYGTFFKK
jgi:hypothetical protein